MISNDDPNATLQDLIQSAIKQFANGVPSQEDERVKADETLTQLVLRFNEVAALPHAERFPALKLIASCDRTHFTESAFNLIYTTNEKDLPFPQKKQFLEERILNPSPNKIVEYIRFLRNLTRIGGLRSQMEAVAYVVNIEATNPELFKFTIKPALENLGLQKDYQRLKREARSYDMLNPTPRETKANDSFFHNAYIVPRNLILATVGVAAVVVGAFLYSTIFNATNGQGSPQKEEQAVEAQPSPASYFQQYKQSPSFPSKYVIGRGQEKTFDALSQQCIKGFTQYLDDISVSAQGLDVKSPCNWFIHDSLKKYSCSVDGNGHILESDGKRYEKNQIVGLPTK